MCNCLIAELPGPHAPHGSPLALFLDGNPANTDQDNMIDQGYFENCYTYEQYLEDLQHRCALLERVAELEAALAQHGSSSPPMPTCSQG
jgi:hypothetical protein